VFAGIAIGFVEKCDMPSALSFAYRVWDLWGMRSRLVLLEVRSRLDFVRCDRILVCGVECDMPLALSSAYRVWFLWKCDRVWFGGNCDRVWFGGSVRSCLDFVRCDRGLGFWEVRSHLVFVELRSRTALTCQFAFCCVDMRSRSELKNCDR
jgi:hypothetical protein